MKMLLFLALAPLALCDATFHSPLNLLDLKRNYLSCEQSYGQGSVICGKITSHFCYNPSLDESCCPLDNGYCKAGDFCAPVAGYCCHNGEDPTTCASRLSFSLPPSSSTTFIVSSLPSLPPPTLSSSTFLSTDVSPASSTALPALLAIASASAPSSASTSLLLGTPITILPLSTLPLTTSGGSPSETSTPSPASIPESETGTTSALPSTLEVAGGTPTAPSSATAGDIGTQTGLHPDFTAPANTTAPTATAFTGGANGENTDSKMRSALIFVGLIFLVVF